MFPLNRSQIAAASAEAVLFQATEDFDILSTADAADGVLGRLADDFNAFLRKVHPADLGYYLREYSADHMVYDYWLTRNRHGAGFWDRGLGNTGDRLTSLAEDGEYTVFLDDNGNWNWE